MSKPSDPIVAFIYDYDGTLIKGVMQDYGLIQAIAPSSVQNKGHSKKFWDTFKGHLKKKDDHKPLRDDEYDDKILAYLDCLLHRPELLNRTQGLDLTKSQLTSYGKEIDKRGYFNGVWNWFGAINQEGRNLGFKIEHYIVSAGHEEIIRGSELAKHFRMIYGCKFLYNSAERPVGIARFINYTEKTQYLFRIGKNTDNEELINKSMPKTEWRIPFKRMLYFGDGGTDIPSMKLFHTKGGYSIAVYEENKPKDVKGLVDDARRANIACSADYRKGSELWDAVINQLEKIHSIHKQEQSQLRSRKKIRASSSS